ncbi:unnamed protein product [Candidula unifasciata]|uniref:Uncharacterized protein n=1 Tax=Candidula unifasciata TaxID=100452 RepID=A0A8S3YKP0_9EUPU|nr:unnamed protein product [Candidula unifasciata]
MYTKRIPTLSCVSRVFELFRRLPAKSEFNASNSPFKRQHSLTLCNNRHLVVGGKVTFYSRCFRTYSRDFRKPDLRLGTGCFSLVTANYYINARSYVTVPQSAVGAPVVGHPSLKPRGGWSSRCCCYSTTVTADGRDKSEELRLEMLAKKIIEAARKRDVMAGSVPLKKVVALLETLHRQGFTLQPISNILSQQVQFLLDLDNMTPLTELLLSHGLRISSIVLFLEKVPFTEKNTSLKQMKISVDDSIKLFRTIGFKESDISTFLSTEPRVLLTNSKILSSVISQLKGLFSMSDVLYVLKCSPNVFCDPWIETRKKFDYVYFEMGYKQAAILNSFMFQHSVDHIEGRHKFLLRAGFFHDVREKDDPKINPNPPLSDVVDTPAAMFAKKFGGFRVEEYETFLEMREVEREEEHDISSESDEEENEEEEEEEVEETHKKKKKHLKRK